jgi:hypothetical protein
MNETNELIQREPDDALDLVLRSELRWEASPALTNQLLALIPGVPALQPVSAEPVVVPAMPPRPRPQPWYTWLVLILTAIAVGLSMAVAWQFYGQVGDHLGLSAMWSQLQAAPAIGLQRLYETIPISQYIVALVLSIRDQLHWLLLAVILWLALDGWSPNINIRHQQPTT